MITELNTQADLRQRKQVHNYVAWSSYCIAKNFSSRKLWQFVINLLLIIFILADLLWKLTNLPVFFCQNVLGSNLPKSGYVVLTV